jgi:DNA-binding CsgD family transcriptional regulator
MLYGRPKEHARISRLLADARAGCGGVLVVRGEAGIGKHTLLEDAAQQAAGYRVLRGAGAEAEVELPFAGLHQMLRPVLDRLNRLPAPQAGALRGAFGLTDEETNRFLIELGVLSLLAVVAAEQPLLCLISQALWLDSASADALVFVGRRLSTERVVLLFAAGDDHVRRFDAPGLPTLQLGGLDATEARELLEARVGALAPAVRDRLIAETRGNPLALLELPATLSSGQLAGSEPLPERLPLSARLQQAFLQQVRAQPTATQMVLLVAAAEDTGDLATIFAAGRILGAGLEALEPAERAGLVTVGGQELRFRHPLVRSAIYQDATFTTRQAAHRALIAVLEGEQQADRRAWHLAAATLGRDEEVAKALEASGDRARRRGGPTAAAAALERAAALTPQAASRVRRLVAAAEYQWEAGQTTQAQALLDRAEAGPPDPAVRARAARVRGQVELGTGSPATACTLLVENARLLLDADPEQATELLVLATRAAVAGNQLDRILQEISPLVRHRPGHPPDLRIQRLVDSMQAVDLGRGPPTAATTVAAARQTATAAGHPVLAWLWPMADLAEPDADALTLDQRYAKAVAAHRAAGTVGARTVALADLALAETALGRWPKAIDAASEGLRLARETGQTATAGSFLALLAAVAAEQGRAEDCRRLAEEALAIATPRRLAVVAAFATWTLGLLELTEGRPAAALDRLRALSTPGHPAAHAILALLATGTLVEAAARAGQLEGMEPFVARFERWARWDRRTWTQVVAHYCRALVTQGEEAERHYQAALAVEGLGELPLELARTELAYGESLRRVRRRADARIHLRAALAVFERLGAGPWAERTRSQLRASGESARRRNPDTLGQLTPQELQVARLADQGLSNRQIAERLFVSRHTVSYHLHKVYTKLGMTSRADLWRLDLGDDGAG